MMPEQVKEFCKTYGVRSDEVWPVPGGKAYAIKHSALERIAADLKIEFDRPQIVEGSTAEKIVTLLVTGSMPDGRAEWTFGEASPANNKNQYPWAMAEKRAKDRIILKLLKSHGAIYSEDELSEAPMRGKATPEAAPRQSSNALKKNSPDLWPKLETAVRAAPDIDALTVLWEDSEEMAATWPRTWQDARWELFEVRTGELQARAA
jgi:hypothetical protein